MQTIVYKIKNNIMKLFLYICLYFISTLYSLCHETKLGTITYNKSPKICVNPTLKSPKTFNSCLLSLKVCLCPANQFHWLRQFFTDGKSMWHFFINFLLFFAQVALIGANRRHIIKTKNIKDQNSKKVRKIERE